MTVAQIATNLLVLIAAATAASRTPPAPLSQPANTWVKLSPLPDTPVSPRLGYEGACVWDSKHRVMVRYGGHNQGGGGEQHAEVWTFDPLTARWSLKEPNTSPPGICCGQQNVFDPVGGRYLRFPAFSGSHGWQWWREIYLNDASVWSYDLGANTWRSMRPFPAASPRPLRCASWDTEHQVVVMFGGEGSREGTLVYDPYTNAWTRMEPSPQPDFRSGGSMAYDAARRRHILFGAQFTDDPHTWAYDLRENAWRDLKPATMPPTDRNDAVLTYDPVHRLVLALVKVTEGEGDNAPSHLETWAYDAGTNRWRRMDPAREPDPSGNRARQLMFAPELGVALLENRTHPPRGEHEQQIWSYRFGEPRPDTGAPPQPPTGLRVTTTTAGATLNWEPSPSPSAARTLIDRGTGEQPWKATFRQIATVSAGLGSYRDTSLRSGTIAFYRVRAADAQDRIGPESVTVRAQPPLVEDLVISVLSPARVQVRWKRSAATDIEGYLVERAVVEVFTEDQLKRLKAQTSPLAAPSAGAIRRIGPFVRVTETPIRGTTFTDTAVDLTRPETAPGEPVYQRSFNADQVDENGKPYRFAVYAYRVRAVNALGVPGGASPACLTLPSTPQHVFAREEGATCHLKWAANPEIGLRGYRVYRMDGRFDDARIPRLTPDPIAALTHADPQAGAAARRYYIVAVDALGQEGFPSAPVWFNRQWRSFYLPFIGEWHQ